MKILTFNHHEPFLSSMADLGYDFDIVTAKGSLDLSWNPTQRTPPGNFRFIKFEEGKKLLVQGQYDAVVCHTIKNLVWLFFSKPKLTIFVAHIPLFWHSPWLALKSSIKVITLALYMATHTTRFTAVSEFKRASWRLFSGELVRFYPVPFPQHLISKKSPHEVITVTVGNGIKKRGAELGWDLLEEILKKEKIRILGRNPDIPSALVPQSFADYVKLFTESHIYIYTIKYPMGDGYNTAMLEAMLQGMPVITIQNPSSPITDGKNGFVVTTTDEILKKIDELKKNPRLRETMGEEARKTVESSFTRENFLAAWRRVLAHA